MGGIRFFLRLVSDIRVAFEIRGCDVREVVFDLSGIANAM